MVTTKIKILYPKAGWIQMNIIVGVVPFMSPALYFDLKRESVKKDIIIS